MLRSPPDRERVLALLWLVGAVLTVVTIALPYRVDVVIELRLGVAVGAAAVGVALLRCPPLPDRAIHGIVLVGTAVVGFCSALGAPQVEGVFLFLPLVFAFATFSGRAAAAHLAFAGVVYAVSLVAADQGGEEVGPLTPWVLVMGVAALLAVALQAGRRDRRIAAVLQDALLPAELPQVPGVHLSARYVPAAREADVGGDLFDVLELPGDALGLVVGDVAGKGLDAAAAIGRVRSALRAYAVEERSPAAVLDRLAHVLEGDPSPVPMTTLLYAVLDLTGEELRWASAGHPPPLLVPADGPPRLLPGATRPPLGARVGGGGIEHSAALVAGDRLLLYTDGVFERRGELLDVGLARLCEEAASAAPGAEGLRDAALRAAGRRPPDDVAVLVAERLAVGAPRAAAPRPATAR